MRPKPECTYCISQMCNTYPDRRRNRIEKIDGKMYITVDTDKEFDYIESINHFMKQALYMLRELETYIEIEKL